MRRCVLIGLLASCLAASSSFAQEENNNESSWVGKTVMTIRQASFRLPGKTVTQSDVCEVMNVDQEKGSWLWIADRGGWVSKRDVVPIEQATDYFTRIIKKDPSAQNFFYRGMAWFRQGRYYVAAGDFKNAIREAPAPGYFNARGEAWRLAGEYKRALADFNAAIKLGPKFAAPYNNRGLTYLATNDLESAIKDFDQAIELDDQFRFAYYNRGLALRQQQEADKAIADFTKAIAIDPSSADALNARGNTWVDKNDLEQARADYQKAIETDDRFAPAYFNRGHLNKLDGNYAEALSDYQKAIEIDEKYAPAYNGVAWLLATCPDQSFIDGPQAIKYAERARELGGGEEDAFLGTLAAAEAEVGNFDRANSLLKRAIELDNDAYREVREGMRSAFAAGKPYREQSGD